MITAITIAEPAAAQLQAGPRRLRVHSAFPSAINLAAGDVQLITLLGRDNDDGPFALRLPCRELPATTTGAPAQVEAGTLTLDRLVIDWQSASGWNPTLKPLARPVNVPFALPAGFQDSDSVFARALTAEDSRQHLRAGLQSNGAALNRTVRALIGLGQGLTPAGDDFLLGVVAARRMLGQPPGELEGAIRTHLSRTTSLSAAFLRAACQGHFAGHWHRLRAALGSRQPAAVSAAVHRILAYGATSGADALAGWIAGIESCRRPETAPVPGIDCRQTPEPSAGKESRGNDR